MPLNLYVFKDKLPPGSNLIWDVEATWAQVAGTLPRPPIVEKALKEIDNSDIIDDFTVKSGLFVDTITIGKCSAGVKAIWLLALDIGVVNVLECGNNALGFIFREFHRGSILQPIADKWDRIDVGNVSGDIDVLFNGKHFSTHKELYTGLEEFPWS